MHGVLPRFPFLAQPAHGFPQAHGQRGDRFEAQFSAVREFAVLFLVNLCQQELRIPQNPVSGLCVSFQETHLNLFINQYMRLNHNLLGKS